MSLTREHIRRLRYQSDERGLLSGALEDALRVVEAVADLGDIDPPGKEVGNLRQAGARHKYLIVMNRVREFRAAYPGLLEGSDVQSEPDR